MRCMFAVIQGALGSSNEILRCAAGEALGRIVQVVGENKFIADMAQYSFDRFNSQHLPSSASVIEGTWTVLKQQKK